MSDHRTSLDRAATKVLGEDLFAEALKAERKEAARKAAEASVDYEAVAEFRERHMSGRDVDAMHRTYPHNQRMDESGRWSA